MARSTRCSRTHFAKRLREARRLRSSVKKDLRPLYTHILNLAVDAARRGNCKRAGREISQAMRLTRYA